MGEGRQGRLGVALVEFGKRTELGSGDNQEFLEGSKVKRLS